MPFYTCRAEENQPFVWQRRTTVMARVPRRFVEESLWPEFQKLSATLRAFLDDITERAIRESVFADDSEAEEVAEARVLAP